MELELCGRRPRLEVRVRGTRRANEANNVKAPAFLVALIEAVPYTLQRVLTAPVFPEAPKIEKGAFMDNRTKQICPHPALQMSGLNAGTIQDSYESANFDGWSGFSSNSDSPLHSQRTRLKTYTNPYTVF